MSQSPHFKNSARIWLANGLVLFILLLINGLYLLKYGAKFLTLEWLITLAGCYLGLVFILAKLAHNIPRKPLLIISTILVLLVSKIGFTTLLDKNLLTNDRWSGMQAFWEFALAGKYPYASAAFDGNTNVASPGYYLMGLPFSLTSQIWAIGAVGGILFFWFCYTKTSYRVWAMLLSLCSIAIWYESVSASTIFLNAAISIIAIQFVFSNQNTLKVGIVLGLLLATRSVIVLPIAIFLSHKIGIKQWGFKQLAITGAIIVAVNLLMYLPLLILYPTEFLSYNPIAEQSERFLPLWAIAILLVAAIQTGLKSTTYKQLLFGTGLILFITALWHAIILAGKFGLVASITESYTDITYFNFCLPFLIAYLAEAPENVTNDKAMSY